MTLTLTRNQRKDGTFKDGCTDAWTASLDGVQLVGIGKSRTEAIGSLVAANLGFFGIDERVDVDPGSAMPVLTWAAYNR